MPSADGGTGLDADGFQTVTVEVEGQRVARLGKDDGGLVGGIGGGVDPAVAGYADV